jgi:dTDP-4-dehydrorhamnose 3,5-epimerase-like enzyme
MFERRDDRGVFREVLNQGSWESLLQGSMEPGAVMGNHYHKKTTVFFYLLSGAAEVSIIDVETKFRSKFMLVGSQGVFLVPNESHAIRFLDKTEFIMMKSLRYSPEDPDTFHFPVEA